MAIRYPGTLHSSIASSPSQRVLALKVTPLVSLPSHAAEVATRGRGTGTCLRPQEQVQRGKDNPRRHSTRRYPKPWPRRYLTVVDAVPPPSCPRSQSAAAYSGVPVPVLPAANGEVVCNALDEGHHDLPNRHALAQVPTISLMPRCR